MKVFKNKRLSIIIGICLAALIIFIILLFMLLDTNATNKANPAPVITANTNTYKEVNGLTAKPNVLHLKQGESAEITEVTATVKDSNSGKEEIINIFKNNRVKDLKVTISNEDVISTNFSNGNDISSLIIKANETVVEDYSIATISANVEGEEVSIAIPVNITDIPKAITLEDAVEKYKGISRSLSELGKEKGWTYGTKLEEADYLLIEQTANQYVTEDFYIGGKINKTVIHQLVGVEKVDEGSSPLPNGLSPEIRGELVVQDELNATVNTLIFDTHLGTGGQYFTFTLVREGVYWKIDSFIVTVDNLNLTWEEAKKYISKISNEKIVKKGNVEKIKEEKNDIGEEIFIFSIADSKYQISRNSGNVSEYQEESVAQEPSDDDNSESSDPPKKKMNTAGDYMEIRSNFYAAMLDHGHKNELYKKELKDEDYVKIKEVARKYITENYYNYLRNYDIGYVGKEINIFYPLVGGELILETRYYHRELGIDNLIGQSRIIKNGSDEVIIGRVDFPFFDYDGNSIDGTITYYTFIKENDVWLLDGINSYSPNEKSFNITWADAKIYIEDGLRWNTITKVGKEKTANGEVYVFTVNEKTFEIRINDMAIFDEEGRITDGRLLWYWSD
jgi:hypothetical protein